MFRLLLPFALLWGVTPAAWAAPPVMQEVKAPATAHYEEAAREVGFTGWGKTPGEGKVVHVMIRPSARNIRVGISVPASVPPAQAEAWLQELSDAMGWTDVKLSSWRESAGTLLRAEIEKGPRSVGLGQQQFRLDIPRLRRLLARLTRFPLVLAVSARAQELQLSDGPAARVTWRQNRYAFFAPGSPTIPLQLTYGMGRRWQVALVCAWLAWALFPTLVFYVVRELQLRATNRTPKERWDAYRRWLKPVWITTLAGMVLTPFMLSLQGIVFLLAPLISVGGGMIFPTFMILSSWVVTPQSLLGYPLAREVSERQREQRFSDLLRKQLIFFVLMNALAPLIFAIPGWIHVLPWGNSTDPAPLWAKLALGFMFLSLPALLLGNWLSAERRWRLRANGLPRGESLASPELVEQVRDLTTRLTTPVGRVILVPKGDMERVRGAVVHGEMATILESLVGKLEAEPLAGVIAAERLGAGQGWRAQLPGAVGIALACLGLGSIAWMILGASSSTFTPSSGQLLPAFICLPLSAVPFQFDQRQRRQRQERADLLVAVALTEPSVFLKALRALELLRMEAGNMDPELIPVPPMFTERRRRLERKLGLE